MEKEILIYAVVGIISYLLGSVTFATLVSNFFTNGELDIKSVGSKNAGASNVLLALGKRAGAITLIGDLLKGFASIYIAKLLAGYFSLNPDLTIAIAFVCVTLGHVFPIYFKFKGGKGTAVMGGAVLTIDLYWGLILLVIFILFFIITKYIVAGTLSAAALLPLTAYFFIDEKLLYLKLIIIGLYFICTVISYVKHAENVKRIVKHEELKVTKDVISKF